MTKYKGYIICKVDASHHLELLSKIEYHIFDPEGEMKPIKAHTEMEAKGIIDNMEAH